MWKLADLEQFPYRLESVLCVQNDQVTEWSKLVVWLHITIFSQDVYKASFVHISNMVNQWQKWILLNINKMEPKMKNYIKQNKHINLTLHWSRTRRCMYSLSLNNMISLGQRNCSKCLPCDCVGVVVYIYICVCVCVSVPHFCKNVPHILMFVNYPRVISL